MIKAVAPRVFKKHLFIIWYNLFPVYSSRLRFVGEKLILDEV